MHGSSWPILQGVALRLFSMATFSAASERNFSTFGFIHSKLRNSLTYEHVKKLVYIKTNHNIITVACMGDDLEFDSTPKMSQWCMHRQGITYSSAEGTARRDLDFL